MMDPQIIERLGYGGVAVLFAWALLQIIKEQLRDLKAEVRSSLQTTLKADNQMREQIYNHEGRIRQNEYDLHDLKNIMNLRRSRDKTENESLNS